jgi:hypothetical protein
MYGSMHTPAPRNGILTSLALPRGLAASKTRKSLVWRIRLITESRPLPSITLARLSIESSPPEVKASGWTGRS